MDFRLDTFHMILSGSSSPEPSIRTSRPQPPIPEESEVRALVARVAKRVEENAGTDEQGDISAADHQTFVITAPGPRDEDLMKSHSTRGLFMNELEE